MGVIVYRLVVAFPGRSLAAAFERFTALRLPVLARLARFIGFGGIR